jgi:uncharacterized damage-inducible protein DinB
LAASAQAREAVGALVRAARALPDVRADHLALVGHSRGGGAALAYVLSGADAQAAVLNSVGYPTAVSARAADVGVPLLLIHGTADTPADGGSPFTAVDSARAFEAAMRRAGREIETVYVAGGSHNGLFASAAQYDASVQRIAAFLRERLASRSAADTTARSGLVGDLLEGVTQAETRILALARAMPAGAHDWRPAAGVRSTREVLVHVAGENFYAAAKWGGRTDAGSGVTGATHAEEDAYERRPHTRAEAVAALERSFVLLREGLAALPDPALDGTTEYARRPVAVRTAWVRTVAHLHEHLGQLIAYARSNGIAPPWSR